jgi:hypothetical protein
MIYGVILFTAFLSGMEIRFLLSVLLKPMTLTGVVRGTRAPMLLAQAAMLLEANFFCHTDRGLGTRSLPTFLALVRRLLRRFRLAPLVGTHAFNCLQ